MGTSYNVLILFEINCKLAFVEYGDLTETSSTSENLIKELKKKTCWYELFPLRINKFLLIHLKFKKNDETAVNSINNNWALNREEEKDWRDLVYNIINI